MTQTIPLLTLAYDCDKVLPEIIKALNRARLQTVRSFDLKTTRITHPSYTCPHHGTEQCDCQMVILQVYEQGTQPTTMVAHGRGGVTYFSMVDSPQQRSDPKMAKSILRVLSRVEEIVIATNLMVDSS
jgi:hypothetical protein